MSFHAGQSFTFGETPSATKWNYLWENDYALADGTGISDNAIDSRHYVDGSIDPEHLASTIGNYQVLYDSGEQVGTSTSMSSGTITAKNLLRILAWIIPSGGTLNIGIRFNNDSAANYAERSEVNGGELNGGADSTVASLNQINTKTAIDANPQFTYLEGYNTSANEKLFIASSVMRGSAGANAPERKEGVYKWVNTSAQITRVDAVDTGGTGDIGAGSRLLVLGRD